MKILHVCQMYPPAIGGNEIHIKELSEHLVQCGEDVTVFTSNALCGEAFSNPIKGILAPGEEKINEVKIKRFPINHGIHRLFFKTLPQLRGGYRASKFIFRDVLGLLSGGPFTIGMVPSIVSFNPSVVTGLNLASTQCYYCYLARKIRKFPLILIPCLHIGSSWVEDPMIYKIMNEANKIVALSDLEKSYLIEKGIQPEKIHVVGVGINPSNYGGARAGSFRKKYHIGENEHIVTFIGRKTKGKGLRTLINAMKIVWQELPGTYLVLAGARAKYTSIIEEQIFLPPYPARNKIILIDDFKEEEKANIIVDCDVFALPSTVESFGIVYLEAWILGKPVIACKDTAPSTIISNGEDGLLVKYGDKRDLGEAIICLLKDRNLGIRLGVRGREKVLSNYTWQIIGHKIRSLYHELVESHAEQ